MSLSAVFMLSMWTDKSLVDGNLPCNTWLGDRVIANVVAQKTMYPLQEIK